MKNTPPALAACALMMALATASPARSEPTRPGITPPEITPGAQIVLKPGQTLMQAVRSARFGAEIAAIRARWAAGHPNAPAVIDGPPVITNGSVVSSSLVVGSASSYPVVEFSYGTGKAGLAIAEFLLTSPSGNVSLYLPYEQGTYANHGKIVFQSPVNAPYYSQPGQWTLTAAAIVDNAGNYTSYTPAQIAAKFQPSSLNVVNNGPVDFTPPVVTAGKILTPTVSLSSILPQFRATLTGHDDVSGLIYPYVSVIPAGQTYGYANIVLATYPVKSGTLTAYSNLYPSFMKPGTYTIQSYVLCDVAGNCLQDYTASDVNTLFGTTTFQVTN